LIDSKSDYYLNPLQIVENVWTNLFKERRLLESCESMALWGISKSKGGRVAIELDPISAAEEGPGPPGI